MNSETNSQIGKIVENCNPSEIKFEKMHFKTQMMSLGSVKKSFNVP